jgi:hypothetical protein
MAAVESPYGDFEPDNQDVGNSKKTDAGYRTWPARGRNLRAEGTCAVLENR